MNWCSKRLLSVCFKRLFSAANLFFSHTFIIFCHCDTHSYCSLLKALSYKHYYLAECILGMISQVWHLQLTSKEFIMGDED